MQKQQITNTKLVTKYIKIKSNREYNIYQCH